MDPGGLVGTINMFNPLAWLTNHGGATSSGSISGVIKWYIYFSIGHFLYMWWKDLIGVPVHSYSSGRSWLRPIGKGLMFILNLFLNLIVRAIFAITPRSDKDHMPSVLLILRDADTFTERFVEPFVVGFAALIAGRRAIYHLLVAGVFGHGAEHVHRHPAERGNFLDYRD